MRWSKDAVQGGGFYKMEDNSVSRFFLDATVSRDVSYQKLLNTLSVITNIHKKCFTGSKTSFFGGDCFDRLMY